jgi:DNA-binding GntR family transcriptional regulator
VSTPGEWESVSSPYLRPRRAGEVDAWAEETAERKVSGAQQLREVAEVPPPDPVAEGLGLGPDEPVIVRRRVMLVDDRPVELTDSYYPLAIARGTALAEPRKIRGGAITLLADLGYRVQRVQEDVSARPATAEESQLLELADGEWVLVLIRLVRSADGRPVEMSIMTMTATDRHLRYQVTP